MNKARIKLRLGDLFDGPSDLIVLPCSTGGTITKFVANYLQHFNIPFPNERLKLGDVLFLPFEGAENIAQYVAFAASVKGNTSDSEAINNIGKKIGEFTREKSSIRLISSPLLGAGAGGLQSETVVENLYRGFVSKAEPDSTLVINVLHENVYERLKENFYNLLSSEDPSITRKNFGSNKPPLRVFISYTSTSISHQNWIKSLATCLRENGLDARLDIWHLRPGMDLPQWMCNELQMANRVIIISDEQYAQRADGRHGGVGWETMIIQGDMSRIPATDNKYLVVVRSEKIDDGLPLYLRTKYCLHCSDSFLEDNFKDKILKELFNVELAPPIGSPPIFI
ncbi:MAG: toll/interleukin-1 receptor domain-containing protein [Ignavibacteriales bacterium]|nr:toll/interleukin-1 receptor domain-containing protein [Ignavibacteriales bacterium]